MSYARNYRKSKFNTFTKIWSLLYLIALLVFVSSMLVLDVVPSKLLLGAFVVLLIISAVFFVQLFRDNIKRSRKITAFILSLILMVVYTVGTAYAVATHEFLGQVTAKKKAEDAVDVTSKPFNIYISGMDTTGKITEEARSDVNMIITVNPKTHKVLMTSIPRDYLVELQNGEKDKLTHTGLMGIDETTSDVEDLLGIKINYYVKVNYNTLKDLVNSIGGITINSDKAFISYIGKYRFVEGENQLDGAKALAYARERHAYSDGDNHRVRNQQEVLKAIVKKLTGSTTLLTRYNKILKYLAPTMEMNLTRAEVKALVKFQLGKNPKWKFESNSLEGFDAFSTVYSAGNQQLYVMKPDEESIKKARQKIKEIEHPKSKSKSKNKNNSDNDVESESSEDDNL
ncbi:MAG: LCP family protein [Mogibacterium diversum]|uniref:LCP family protein n=1 Tax=Mogibacterium diversum TaxID=114527 RepID=UPI001CABEEC3|nr:LCP family protein [Mogibacterium diversum]MBF1340653.1 LCP family protein [Mogibacterium diversum]